jgi:hypothetical protein
MDTVVYLASIPAGKPATFTHNIAATFTNNINRHLRYVLRRAQPVSATWCGHPM